MLSTAHPAEFSEAVTKALSTSQGFDFERDMLFQGSLEKEKRVVDVDEANKGLVKKVTENKVGFAGNGGQKHQKRDRQQNPWSITPNAQLFSVKDRLVPLGYITPLFSYGCWVWTV